MFDELAREARTLIRAAPERWRLYTGSDRTQKQWWLYVAVVRLQTFRGRSIELPPGAEVRLDQSKSKWLLATTASTGVSVLKCH
jgi:hypothetical protein